MIMKHLSCKVICALGMFVFFVIGLEAGLVKNRSPKTPQEQACIDARVIEQFKMFKQCLDSVGGKINDEAILSRCHLITKEMMKD